MEQRKERQDSVQRPVSKLQCLGVHLTKLNTIVETRSCRLIFGYLQHPVGKIDTYDFSDRPYTLRRLEGNNGSARAHVEHRVSWANVGKRDHTCRQWCGKESRKMIELRHYSVIA